LRLRKEFAADTLRMVKFSWPEGVRRHGGPQTLITPRMAFPPHDQKFMFCQIALWLCLPYKACGRNRIGVRERSGANLD
jgi:hypothetical protein